MHLIEVGGWLFVIGSGSFLKAKHRSHHILEEDDKSSHKRDNGLRSLRFGHAHIGTVAAWKTG
jgi:hypothetical protein